MDHVIDQFYCMMGLKVEYFVMEKHFDFWVEIANSESMAHYFNFFK